MQVKAIKDLIPSQQKTLNVPEKVAQEAKKNIQIHGQFPAAEKKDIAKDTINVETSQRV